MRGFLAHKSRKMEFFQLFFAFCAASLAGYRGRDCSCCGSQLSVWLMVVGCAAKTYPAKAGHEKEI